MTVVTFATPQPEKIPSSISSFLQNLPLLMIPLPFSNFSIPPFLGFLVRSIRLPPLGLSYDFMKQKESMYMTPERHYWLGIKKVFMTKCITIFTQYELFRIVKIWFISQPVFTYPKLTIETLEQCVKYV